MHRASTCILSRVEVFGTRRRLLAFGAIQLSDGLGTQLEHVISDAIFSYSRVLAGPCTITRDPFAIVRAYSANLPNITARCKSVRL